MINEELRETAGTKQTITSAGLPSITGAETELAQAEEIRTRILLDADDVLSRLRSDQIITEAQNDTDILSPRQVTSDQVHSAEIALNRLRGQTDAEWWAAQSGRSAGEILGDLMTAAVGHQG